MFAVTAARIDADDPLSALELGEHPDPSPPEGWTTVTVRAAALNHHDIWTLRGVGISADRLRHCEAPSCPHVLVDTTPDRSQAYCGDRCAAKASVTALHVRRRSPGSETASTAAV